jgi:manganese/iron transport system ATP-binding protein
MALPMPSLQSPQAGAFQPARTAASSAEAIAPIRVNHLDVFYRDLHALADVSVAIRPGRLTGIVGPNGAGKSTLMKAMLGLIPASQGTVNWGTETLLSQRERLAYLPQRAQIDWRYPATAWDVVMMGRVHKSGWLRKFSATSQRAAEAALKRVGMEDFAHRPIGQLSGGQQQRIFLARALAQEADVLFLDEPMTGVDKKTEAVLFDILHELADEGKIVLAVHHDLGATIQNFDEVILLNREVIASGARDEVLQSEFMRQAYGGWAGTWASAAA